MGPLHRTHGAKRARRVREEGCCYPRTLLLQLLLLLLLLLDEGPPAAAAQRGCHGASSTL